VAFAGGVPVPLSSSAENRFEIRAADVEAAITPKTKALLMSYPSNPTGATMDREEVRKIVDVAIKHDLYIISDEIYDKLTYDGEHTCVPTIPGAYERTIYLNGFSKAYAMTGWRIAYAAANPEIIEMMMKIHQYTMLCAPMMGQVAAVEAIKNGEDDSQEMIEQYNHRRRVIVNGFNKIGLKCMMPGGAFYAFPSIKSTGMTCEEFAEKLLFDEKVAVVPGNAFGDCGEGHIRCSYATAIDRIEEALRRIDKFLSKQ
jgi:aminotransferase